MGVTSELAGYVESLNYRDLSDDVREMARHCLLDTVGNALGGRVLAKSSERIETAVTNMAPKRQGPCTVLGDSRTFTPLEASFLNGTFSHSLDFDDVNVNARGHVGTVVVPSALAAAEQVGATGQEFLVGIVAGYEITSRVGSALGNLYRRGFHPTAIAGVFGATAAAGKLFQLTDDQLTSAFGINGSQAAGSMQYLENGAHNKRLHAGFMSRAGVLSASLAEQGVRGSKDPLTGRFGVIRGYSPDGDPEAFTEELGETYMILDNGFKPYPSCRFTHGAIDALIELHPEIKSTDSIQRIEVTIGPDGYPVVAEPAEDKRRPKDVVDGQFSLHFTAAVAVDEGRVRWSAYQRLDDNHIRELMDRIYVQKRESLADGGCRVRVETNDKSFEKRVEIPRGEPENPLSKKELRRKFRNLAGQSFSEETVTDLIESIETIEEANNLRALGRSWREAFG